MSKTVPVTKLREFACAIRGVDKGTRDYQNLVESVAKYGILEPLTVIKANDPTTGELLYGIVHGLERYHAACDAGVKMVPVYITEMTDEQIEKAQLISAIHKIDVKPVQVSKAMCRVLGRQPNIDLNEMAELACKTPDWVAERFGIARSLTVEASELVIAGKICLSNAYALAKLRPASEQYPFVHKAQVMAPCEFAGQVMARYKELKDAYRKAKSFEPVEIEILKPKEFKGKHTEIEVGQLLVYIGTKVVKVVNGHHRCMCIDPGAKIKIRVVQNGSDSSGRKAK